MARLLFILILLYVGYQWLAKAIRRADNAADPTRNRPFGASGRPGANGNGNGNGAGGGSGSRPPPPRLAEPMVRCTMCGVHTPQSESILIAGQRFCCAEHAERYAARPTGRTAR